MSRTFKNPPEQNLIKVPVLIEDTKFYSDYFEVSQLNRIFHAGRNGFLIRGSEFLALDSGISVEVIDRYGNAVFATPVVGYSEGGSRLVSIEIFQKTAKGPGKLIILGTAERYANGRPIPTQHRGRPNVRWIVPIQIEPSNQNTTEIRLANSPITVATEREFTTTRLDVATVTDSTYTASLVYDHEAHKSDGYAINMLTNSGATTTFFDTVNVDGIFTGSIFKRVMQSSSPGGISVVSPYTTASVSMSLDKVLNKELAVTTTPIIFGDKTDYLNPILYSGSYRRTIKGMVDASSKQTFEEYTSSVVFQYPSESLVSTDATSSIINFRIPFVQTHTGEIAKIKVSAKEANKNITAFQPFTEFICGERNFFVTSSDIGDISAGSFISQSTLDNNWFAASVTQSNGDFNRLDWDSFSASAALSKAVVTSSAEILEGAFVDNTNSSTSYFFGTKNHFQFFEKLKFFFQKKPR